MAMTPGLEGKPIEAVENACASGGQAVLSVIQKLQLGMGETGIAVGYEKMRDDDGKMDGKLIGEVLGLFLVPRRARRQGLRFPPHLRRSDAGLHGRARRHRKRDLAAIAVQEYANAKFNSCAQMSKVQITLDQALKIEGFNRYVVDGLPLKTYDCSQITDGYASLILATEEGLAKLGVPKPTASKSPDGGRPPIRIRKAGRDVLHPAGAYRAMSTAYQMAGASPAGRQRGRSARLLHRDGRDRHGGHRQSRARQGRAILGGRQSAAGWRVRHQHIGRADRQGPPRSAPPESP